MASCGLPVEDIAKVIGVAKHTLRKHCAEELDTAHIKVRALVGNFIVASILGRDGGVKDERTRGTLAMFFAKTQMNWRETSVHELTGKDGGAIEVDIADARNRIAAELDKIAERLPGNASGGDEKD